MGMFAPGKVCPEPFVQPSGRWPANLIHDGSEEVMECFPDNVKGGTWNRTDGARPFNNEGKPTNYKSAGSDKSVGSAARFFYCAKASKADRGEGNDHPTVKPIALMKYLVKLVCRQGGMVLDPFCGSGTTGVAAVELGNSFIGIERDGHYFSIANSRVGKAAEKMDETAEL
jgi:site-specific DNA-methyltransferase (adenine-specific)